MAMKLLNEYLGDNKHRFIKIIKKCLKEDTPQKIILFGTGANGKTTLLRMIQNTFPDAFDVSTEYSRETPEKHTIYEINELPPSDIVDYHLFFFNYKYVSGRPLNKFEKRLKTINIIRCGEVFA